MSKTILRKFSEMYSDNKKGHNNRKNTKGRRIQSIYEDNFPTKRIKYIQHSW